MKNFAWLMLLGLAVIAWGCAPQATDTTSPDVTATDPITDDTEMQAVPPEGAAAPIGAPLPYGEEPVAPGEQAPPPAEAESLPQEPLQAPNLDDVQLDSSVDQPAQPAPEAEQPAPPADEAPAVREEPAEDAPAQPESDE